MSSPAKSMKSFAQRFLDLAESRSPFCLGIDPTPQLLAAWNLPHSAEGLAQMCETVATAAEEQTATTSEISNNMQQITEVIAKTSRGTKESASAANQLSVLADDLRRIVSQFKVA